MHLLIRVAKHKSCQTSSLQKNFNIWYFFAKQRREKIWVIRVSWRFLMPRLQLMLSAEKKPESKTMGQFFSFSLSLSRTHTHAHTNTFSHSLSLSLLEKIQSAAFLKPEIQLFHGITVQLSFFWMLKNFGSSISSFIMLSFNQIIVSGFLYV